MERKTQRLSLIASSFLLLVLVALTFWQTSLRVDLYPQGPAETVVLWAIFTLVVLGAFTLGFIVFRTLLKLFVARRRNLLGAKIKTKLVAGALALSILPAVCLVIFSFSVLSRTLDKWFTQPAQQMFHLSDALTERLNELMEEKTANSAAWIASLPEAAAALDRGAPVQPGVRAKLRSFASGAGADYVALLPKGAAEPIELFGSGRLFDGPVAWPPMRAEPGPESGAAEEFIYSRKPVIHNGETLGQVIAAWRIPDDLAAFRSEMERHYHVYATLHEQQQFYRYFYSGMLGLITVFVLFVATWLALFLSKQIMGPIEALVRATSELSSGRLGYQVRTKAVDELGSLVESFNRMSQQLESKTRQLEESNRGLAEANVELESRRRFINAILESIATGVISTSAQGEILKVNSALSVIFPPEKVRAARRLSDLFSAEDYEELNYMMNRARRTGSAAREFEIRRAGRILHLAVTVSALEQENQNNGAPPGFVVVLEDTTELLRAQKSAAWNEVARRIAHEIKNPLTPIALSAGRMDRLIERLPGEAPPAERAEVCERLRNCTKTIAGEVDTLRRLVDEFAQFSRFPKATLERADLNHVVRTALDVFQGRLSGIRVKRSLAEELPAVNIDPEQFKRVLVNLIDNAAEALQDAWVREIHISTAPGPAPDSVELAVADTGAGISAEDKQKLFLPYFSTKKRGTGLGLAIVSRILSEHKATIRVEDNRPSGSRFIVEVPAAEPVPARIGAPA